ncbi:hypothetical protein ACH3Y9_41915 [Streptomyces sp. WSLK1-5]|uniref:hypothetical protein n=1 Tax=unclassified Streptomyces TaxID=2593676 RepID=UPI00378B2C97
MPQRTHLDDEFGDPLGHANRDTPPVQAVRERATGDRAADAVQRGDETGETEDHYEAVEPV